MGLSVGYLCCGCGAALNNESTAAAADTPATEQVLSCYSREYQSKFSTKPPIDDQERDAADRLLARYNARPKRVCGAIQSALTNEPCEAPKTLAAIWECESRHKRGGANADLNPAVKAAMDQRIHLREQNALSPGDR